MQSSDLPLSGLDWGQHGLRAVADQDKKPPIKDLNALPTETAKVLAVTDKKTGAIKSEQLHLTLKEETEFLKPDGSKLHFAKQGSGEFLAKETKAGREISLTNIEGLEATAEPSSKWSYLGKSKILKAQFTHSKGVNPGEEDDSYSLIVTVPVALGFTKEITKALSKEEFGDLWDLIAKSKKTKA
jgi:hypothetical protein